MAVDGLQVTQDRARSGRRRVVLRVVAALAVLLALTWWVNPRTFTGWSPEPGTYGITPPEGEAVWLDAAVYGTPGDVRLLGAWASVSVGRDADVSLVVCSPGPDGGIGAIWGDDEAEPLCSARRDPRGAALATADQLVVRIAPDGREPVVVDHVRVLYLDGLRPGLQKVGSPLVVQPVDLDVPARD